MPLACRGSTGVFSEMGFSRQGCFVDGSGIELMGDLPVPASQVRSLKVCTAMLSVIKEAIASDTRGIL